MSVATEISRIQTARNTIRSKAVELGIGTSTDDLTKLQRKLMELRTEERYLLLSKRAIHIPSPKATTTAVARCQGCPVAETITSRARLSRQPSPSRM